VPKSNLPIARERNNLTPTRDESRHLLVTLENQSSRTLPAQTVVSGEIVTIRVQQTMRAPAGEPLEVPSGRLTDFSGEVSTMETDRANNKHRVIKKESPSAV
jgi:hypothetical protein